MELKKITAIIRSETLRAVENRSKGPDTPSITVDHVKGYGEYANFFARDWTSRYARIDVIAEEPQARSIVRAIVEVVHTGTEGDGIVYVVPVEQVHRIRDQHTVRSSRTRCPRCRASLCARVRQQKQATTSRPLR